MGVKAEDGESSCRDLQTKRTMGTGRDNVFLKLLQLKLDLMLRGSAALLPIRKISFF